jgi:hypothetical protein
MRKTKQKKRKLKRESIQHLVPKDWCMPDRAERTTLRRVMVIWMLVILSLQNVATIAFYYLTGVENSGFKLSYGTLHWLGTASLGYTGAITFMVYKCLFRE